MAPMLATLGSLGNGLQSNGRRVNSPPQGMADP